jgi:FlaA1/EpsC-like NDP-sugar epimerase
MKTVRINERAILAFAFDCAMVLVSWSLTLALAQRLAPAHVDLSLRSLVVLALLAIFVQGSVSTVFGMYRSLWRYASLPDVQRIVVCVIGGTLALALVVSGLQASVQANTQIGGVNLMGLLPNIVTAHFFINALLLIVLMAGSRITYRSLKEWHAYGKTGLQGTPVLVLGAGDTAVGLMRQLSRGAQWRVVGLLDDDTNKHQILLQNQRVLGSLEKLPEVARDLRVSHAILAMPSATYAVRRRILELCNRANVTVLTMPGLDTASPTGTDAQQLDNADASAQLLRRVDVDDLLRRDSITLDAPGVDAFIHNQVVMVTGAGGSIGSELVRQIARHKPSLLILFEQNEFALYTIDLTLRSGDAPAPIISVVGDVKNRARVEQIMRQYAPSVVFHAAAYKHVPMMEEANAWEAVQNNVLGTLVVAQAALKHNVRKWVLVSTDKAVNPTNVMGATKRLAEMVCQSLQQQGKTRFEIVRFGNVLGSAGSVIPLFQSQIERGGPITVTHPEMVRYFMSIPEAAQLVLQAGAMGLGGEVFVLDMGEPVKIADLARDMIRLANAREEDIKIIYTGLRPGEKLFEELLADNEHTRATPHPKLRIAKAREVEDGFIERLGIWLARENLPEETEVRRDLQRWVPEYVTSTKPKLVSVVKS